MNSFLGNSFLHDYAFRSSNDYGMRFDPFQNPARLVMEAVGPELFLRFQQQLNQGEEESTPSGFAKHFCFEYDGMEGLTDALLSGSMTSLLKAINKMLAHKKVVGIKDTEVATVMLASAHRLGLSVGLLGNDKKLKEWVHGVKGSIRVYRHGFDGQFVGVFALNPEADPQEAVWRTAKRGPFGSFNLVLDLYGYSLKQATEVFCKVSKSHSSKACGLNYQRGYDSIRDFIDGGFIAGITPAITDGKISSEDMFSLCLTSLSGDSRE